MGSTSTPPPAPRYDWEKGKLKEFQAAIEQWTTDMDAYAKEQDAFLKGVGDEVLGVQLPAMQDMYQWAQDDRQRYEDVFIPQQDKYIEMANTYASPEEEARQRAAAGQDTAAAYEAQKEAQLRKLESYGVDPSQARYAGLDQRARLSQAAASAMNQNTAGERTKAIGRELQAKAINIGAGLPASAAAQAGGATNIGASALAGAGGTVALGLQGKQSVLPGYQLGMSAVGQEAGIKNMEYGGEMGEFNAKVSQEGGLGGIGALVGTGIGAYFGGPMGAAAGAKIGGAAEGGGIDAPGGPREDGGVLRLSDGEYVLPSEVVNNLGAGLLDKFVEKQTGVLPTRKQALPVGV